MELAPRQLELLRLLSMGLCNEDIGKEIGTSRYVVVNKIKVLMDILRMRSRLELALWYVKHVEDKTNGRAEQN